MLVNWILLGLIICSGFLANLPKETRFHLVKAVVIVGIETCLGVILFTLFISLSSYTALRQLLLSDFSSLFSVVLLVAVMNGFFLYWLNVFIIPKCNIGSQVLTLCEYIIQWSLIYVTVYQVLFDNLVGSVKSSDFSRLGIENLDMANPTELILLVLPSLISVWIAIILYKVKSNKL